MDNFFTLASLSIKAVNAYFNMQTAEKMDKIIAQNQSIINYLVMQNRRDKVVLLNQACMELRDWLICKKSLKDNVSLNLSYDHFTQLANLPLSEKLADDCWHSNEEFISMGLYGRFVYFGLIDDYANATIQVYSCAVSFPRRAVDLFDSSFFPNIDFSSLHELCENLELSQHHKPLKGIYSNIPNNMAEALLQIQIDKYKKHFINILNILNQSYISMIR